MRFLNHRIYGNGNKIVYILHGIFGMKDNWHNIAQKLADTCTVITADARNHGKSFHDFQMSFDLMSDDLAALMGHLGHKKAIIMGHSMGGKTAMSFAAKFPEKVEKLIVVDIGVKSYPAGHTPYFEAFENIDFSILQSRTEAEEAFEPYAPDFGVRQFLLKNLEPLTGGGYKPRFNLPAIKSFYSESIGELHLKNQWAGESFFIYGEKSSYVLEEDFQNIRQFFPAAKFQNIKNAGHWVHADNPAEFLAFVLHFIHG